MTPISDEAVTYVGTTAMVPLVVARALERRLEAAERDAARYQAIRQAHSMLKLYVYDDPGDYLSGDWLYKPSPETVDNFADELHAAISQSPPT